MSGRKLVVEADGGSRGNPGKAGYGALVIDARTSEVLAERAASVGIASNNVAEYSGLIAGLRAAIEIDPGADVRVRMDSKLVVEQMSGRWKIKHADMRRLAAIAGDLAAELSDAGGSVTFSWIPRAENSAADKLANAAMDGFTIARRLDGGGAVPAAAASSSSGTVSPGAGSPGAGSPGAVSPELPSGAYAVASTRLILVRHGVTDFTDAGKLDGRGGSDPALNATGLEQARRAGAAIASLLPGVGPVAVVTSSLQRARQTGEQLALELSHDLASPLQVETDADWDEQDFGDWDGKSIGQLSAFAKGDLERFRSDPAYARPGGENHRQLAERVLTAFDRAAAREGTVVVATHRKPLIIVLAHLLAIPHDRIWRLATAPASLTGVELWADGRTSVSFVNDTLHLR